MTHADIVFIISDMGFGGAQKVMRALLHHYGTNYKVALITLSDPSSDFLPLPEGITRIALNETGDSGNILRSLYNNYRRIRKIRKAVKKLKPKTVVSFIAPTNILTILATRFLPVRVVISERNDPTRQSFGLLWDRLRRFLYRHADLITANSRNAIHALSAYVPRAKLAYIPNPLEEALPENIVPPEQKDKRILIVGRLHPQKAHDTLFKAFSLITQDFLDWKIIVVGDGELKTSLEILCGTLGISGKVDFVGVTPSPENYYRTCPVFVLPSRHEGTPNALLEAMNHGLAVIISTSCEGVLPLIQNQSCGLIFETGNEQALAENMRILMSDLRYCALLGKQAQKNVSIFCGKNVFSQWDLAIQPGKIS